MACNTYIPVARLSDQLEIIEPAEFLTALAPDVRMCMHLAVNFLRDDPTGAGWTDCPVEMLAPNLYHLTGERLVARRNDSVCLPLPPLSS